MNDLIVRDSKGRDPYCAVMAHPEGFASVYVCGDEVVCEVNFVERWRRKAGRGLMFLDGACAPNGTVVAIGVEVDEGPIQNGGTVFVVEEGVASARGPASGVQPVAIGHNGFEFVAFIMRSSSVYERIARSSTLQLLYPHGTTSQGITQVRPGLTAAEDFIAWADMDRVRVFNGLSLVLPVWTGDVTVGQADPAQIAGYDFASDSLFTVMTGFAFEPKIAKSGDRYCVCARSVHGAAFRILPPFPAFVGGAAPVHTDAPPPHADAPPEKPVSIPEVLRDQLPLVREIRDRLYPGGQPLNDAAKAFQITKHVAYALRAHGVGLVKAKPGSDNNVEGFTNDIVALPSGAHWDVLIGGDGDAFASWSLVEEKHWAALAPRWSAPVQPEGASEPTHVDAPPPPPVEDGQLAKRVEQLEKRIDAIQESALQLTLIVKQLNGSVATLNEEVQKLRSERASLPKLRARGEIRLTLARTQQIDVPVVEVK